jgi:hypothetical protein
VFAPLGGLCCPSTRSSHSRSSPRRSPSGFPGKGPEAGTWLRVAWGVTLLVVVAFVALTVLRPLGVDLRDDAAVVIGPLRRRVIPWREVQAVAFRRGRDVTLYLADGREVRCPYPSHNMLFASWQRVNDDFHRIGQWWLAYRGPDWRPVFAPPPHPPPAPFPPATPRSVEDIWRTPPESRR